jgi:hypothetical protein
MSRIQVATLVGVVGFVAYVVGVVTLADHLVDAHWLLQIVYFVVAGIIWAFPAAGLIAWAVRGRRAPPPG